MTPRTSIASAPASEGTLGLDVGAYREELQALYAALDAEVAALAPACLLSGRCCRFREYDHTLFLTQPEAALLLADAPPPVRPLDDGQTCPWQDAQGRCTAREARPSGCRVFFCDPRYAPHAPEITERFLTRLRDWTRTRLLPWNYAPLHRHLHPAFERAVDPTVPGDRPVASGRGFST